MAEPSARERDAVVSALALLASRVYRDERDADVTNVMALVDAYAEQAVAGEREACARIAEGNPAFHDMRTAWGTELRAFIADRIRQRATPPPGETGG